MWKMKITNIPIIQYLIWQMLELVMTVNEHCPAVE